MLKEWEAQRQKPVGTEKGKKTRIDIDKQKDIETQSEIEQKEKESILNTYKK